MTGFGERSAELIGGAIGTAIGNVLAFIFVRPIWALVVALKALFYPTGLSKERQDTYRLFEEATAAFRTSPHAGKEPVKLVSEIVGEAMDRAEQPAPGLWVWVAYAETVEQLMVDEGWWGVPDIDWSKEHTIDEAVRLRNYLRGQRRLFSETARLWPMWRETVVAIGAGLSGYLPPHLGQDDDEGMGNCLRAPLVDLADEPAEMIERLLISSVEDEIVEEHLFEDLRERFDANALIASGINPLERHTTKKEIILPMRMRRKTPVELVELYLGGTPFEQFMLREFPFEIPEEARFEHCHIVGGTGHGKTQLLQLLIHQDLMRVREGDASLVVIDSTGDLIRKLSHLEYFSPSAEQSLADRLLLIDPNDLEFPVALNMFDANLERLQTYSAVEREKILNGTVELYEYIFGALLGAELTQKQGVIFRYLARLMLIIPGATVQTLRELMEDGTPFKPYMAQLEGTTRRFFETQFFERSFAGTKQQILRRLWGVLSNTTFERMFSNPTNKIDLFKAMNSGKVILINTAKDLLKQEGCEIFGRFFIAMIAQAALQRAALPESKRRPTYVYVDEAHDYFDDNVGHILNQARKYRVALHVAHQNLDQLSHSLMASIMASTSTKLTGGMSAKDAGAFAREMRCEPEFLQNMRKRRGKTEFACWIKNTTPQPIRLTVPLGFLEGLPEISADDYDWLVGENRLRYCVPREQIDLSGGQAAPVREAPAPAPPPAAERRSEQAEERVEPARRTEARPTEHAPTPGAPEAEESPRAAGPASTPGPQSAEVPGRGGPQHKYLQQLIKQAADEFGYRASIEETLPDGGRVDLALQKGNRRIACEISVTSTVQYEIANIRKCLGAGFDQVAVLSSDQRRLSTLQRGIKRELSEEEQRRVQCLLPDAFIAYLEEAGGPDDPPEQTIRGYRVKVKRQSLDPKDAAERRKAIAAVIARSLRQLDEKS